MQAFLILGNQLFPPKHLKPFAKHQFFMCEDYELANARDNHKTKVAIFLSAMRHYRDSICANGYNVTYYELSAKDTRPYLQKLRDFLVSKKIKNISFFEIEDKQMEQSVMQICQQLKISIDQIPSPMFLCSREQFRTYLRSKPRPMMKTFYEWQRRRLNIFMEGNKPHNGKFSFDAENRKKLPKNYQTPSQIQFIPDQIDEEVTKLVRKKFTANAGEANLSNFPTTRASALKLMHFFIEKKLDEFGPYQDAIATDDSFLNHSLLSTSMNMGLITPQEVIDAIIIESQKRDISYASLEGFVRQIIGWREFVRGIYQEYSQQMQSTNFWNHHRSFSQEWYSGETGLPPLDDAILRANRTGYSHHIERLMILANLMNLCEIHPQQVHDWFMGMYVDSDRWVMCANVYGMGLMSDGGLFATKPYISGSNYILKMSHYKKGDWCDIWDGLFWRFIGNKHEFFEKNPRMRMMIRSLEKMQDSRRRQIFSAAETFLEKVTITAAPPY